MSRESAKFSHKETKEGSQFDEVSFLLNHFALNIVIAEFQDQTEKFVKEGEDKTLYQSGNQYEGEYHEGLRHGRGVFQFKNGSRYEGEYKKGLKHGLGKFIYCDGSVYAGNWKSDQKHGFGKYIYENGDIYEGTWKKDVKHGVGVYKYREATIAFKANWIDGLPKGPIEIFYQNFRYHGSWNKNMPVGEGVFSFGMKYIIPGHIEMCFKPLSGGTKSLETLKLFNMESSRLPSKLVGRESLKSRNENENATESDIACVPRFVAHENSRYDYSKMPLQPIPLPQGDSSTTICTQSSIESFCTSVVSSVYHDTVQHLAQVDMHTERCNYYQAF